MRALARIFNPLLLGVLLTACGVEISPSFESTEDMAQIRVVSTSLCSDTYVLDAVPHDNILALSWQSGDGISTAPASFKDKPKASDDAESLLALNPTLVVFGPGEGMAAKPPLDKRGIKYVTLDWAESFSAMNVNRAKLSRILEKKHFNPPIIMQTNVNQPKLLYLSSSGGTAGPGTYVDAAIKRAGGHNIITTPGWHTPSTESLALLKPDLIVTSFFNDGYASINEAGLRNKVLQDKIKSIPRVNVPGKLWPCAGPGLYEASDIIKRSIEGLE
jgi:iron complex transport system substrate-binding protein